MKTRVLTIFLTCGSIPSSLGLPFDVLIRHSLIGRRSQVVRQRSAKPLSVSSILTAAFNRSITYKQQPKSSESHFVASMIRSFIEGWSISFSAKPLECYACAVALQRLRISYAPGFKRWRTSFTATQYRASVFGNHRHHPKKQAPVCRRLCRQSRLPASSLWRRRR
jgi:hypothetical protein